LKLRKRATLRELRELRLDEADDGGRFRSAEQAPDELGAEEAGEAGEEHAAIRRVDASARRT